MKTTAEKSGSPEALEKSCRERTKCVKRKKNCKKEQHNYSRKIERNCGRGKYRQRGGTKGVGKGRGKHGRRSADTKKTSRKTKKSINHHSAKNSQKGKELDGPEEGEEPSEESLKIPHMTPRA